MKISAIIPNLATNHIVRVWPVLKALERNHEVEAIACLYGSDEAFPPYAQEFPYKIVRWDHPGQLLRGLRSVEEQITGDLVYAFQPQLVSLGVALRQRRRTKRPVFLDITDWEVWSAYRHEGRTRHALDVVRHLLGPGWSHHNSVKYRYLVDKLIRRVDGLTVVATFLQRRYGGRLLRHGPDTRVFDPARFDRKQLRQQWGLPHDARLIVFAGTASKWKGLDDLLQTLERPGRPAVRLVMAGKAVADLPPNVIHLGFLPHERMPELLALGDLVVLPQKRHPMAEAQIPAKLFEAMAMAKPVVATGIGDVPEVLDGCGVVVDPENPDSLAAGVDRVLADPAAAEAMGRRAREKAVREFSFDAMERVLEDMLQACAEGDRGRLGFPQTR